MSVNSMESLLARMAQGSVTQGWGAVSVFSRGRLNLLLEQQYIERFNGQNFIPPFSGPISLGEGSYDLVELKNIGVGQPLLSFNTASLTDSRAVLTMNIIGGQYTASRQAPGAPHVLISKFNITESLGFKLEMDIDLSLVVGEIDKRGKVKLNLSEGVNFRCNIAGSDEATNERFASFFKQRFEELPENCSVFQLGMLDLKGYNHLTPVLFRLLTQAAPGAKVKGATNFAEGGVVVCIQLRGNSSQGKYPLDASFPYLIPDDKEQNGHAKYSASLIVSETMIPYIEGNQLEVLNNLLFPGDNFFEVRERHAPRDMAVFGNISPKQTRAFLDPAFKTLKAGDTEQFNLRDATGQLIQASEWSAVSLQSHSNAGHGSIANGFYTTASQAIIGRESLHIVITAKYIHEGVTYSASALRLVVFDEMSVAPRLATYATRPELEPIVLTASTTDANPVTWSLLAPEYGTLAPRGTQALFTPDARASAKGLVVQRVEASDGEKRESALVLVNAQQQLNIDPPYVLALKKSDNVQLKDDASLLPGVARRWKVISGDGTVDTNGRFTAPASGNESCSVVQCEIVRNGVVLSSGYSVVDLSELEPEPSWKDLAQFTVTVPGGLESGRLGSLYCNGYQQLMAQILVETVPVDGVAYPLSVIERASLRLVADASKDEMEFVDDALEGIPEEDDELWRARLFANRFELSVPRLAGHDASASADPAVITKDMYVHTRARGGATATFHAMFQADSDKKWRRSTDITDRNNKVELTPLAIPFFTADDYEFKRTRVDGGSAAPGDPEEDNFDFHLRTVDYWALHYTGRPGGLQGTTFETLEFLPINGMDINTSTIRWESEQLAETMFSWTGYYFQDSLEKLPGPTDTPKIQFNEHEDKIVLGESLDINVNLSYFERGTLVFSLHRSDRVPYIKINNVARAKLSRDLAVVLVDKRGNTHKRRIAFPPASTVGDRNRLLHTLFTPAS